MVYWSWNLAQAGPESEALPLRIHDSLLLSCRDTAGNEMPSGAWVEIFILHDADAALPATAARQTFDDLSNGGADPAALLSFLQQGYAQPLDAIGSSIHVCDGSIRPFSNSPRSQQQPAP